MMTLAEVFEKSWGGLQRSTDSFGLRRASACAGFTLPELIMVLVLIGILATVAIPRMVDRATFDQRAFADRTAATLRYAQKSAVAQRRTVCVDFSAAGVSPTMVSLRIASAFGGACDMDLAGPDGNAPMRVIAAVGVAFAATSGGNPPPFTYPANFTFASSGSASLAQIFMVQGLIARPITVEGATGYVH